MKISRVVVLGFAAFAALGSASGCGRSDFLLLDHVEPSAGESGTDAGGTSFGGTGTGAGGTGAGGTSAGGTGFGGSGVGGSSSCGGGFTLCGGMCVDTTSNHDHCGGCFQTCAPDAVCSNTICTPLCGGLTNCSGQCTDTQTDPSNCGRCGVVCNTAAFCRAGSCTTNCGMPFVLCGGQCVDVSSDPRHCGSCDVQCTRTGELCTGGTCQCPGRQAACGNRCTDLQTDTSNCGRCGLACASNQICADGACRLNCPAEFSECNGECRNLQTDPDHCGACANSCPRTEVCNAGNCDTSCGNLTSCSGFCRDLQHDPGHCGGCNTACSPDQVCTNGVCSLVCGPGITNCSGVCHDLRVDPSNCGACGHVCSMRQLCRASTCVDVTSTLYAVSVSPAAFIDACGQPGPAMILPNIDDAAQSVMIPWAFPFYGVPTQSAWVSTNGILGFGSPSATYINECALGSVPRAIFAFWDDLVTRPNGVCIATVGTQPNRTFVATWSDAYILAGSTGSHVTFSVQLTESTGTIDVMYASMTGGGTLSTGTSASIGLASDNAYTLDCCNQGCVMSNTGRRYTPVIR